MKPPRNEKRQTRNRLSGFRAWLHRRTFLINRRYAAS